MLKIECILLSNCDETLLAEWERFLAALPERRSMYQSPMWATWLESLLGKDSVSLYLLRDTSTGEIMCGGFGAQYPLQYGYYWLYFPRGPICSPRYLREHTMPLRFFFQSCLENITHKKCVWIRTDALFSVEEKNYFYGLQKAHSSFHPKKTLLLDMTKNEEALLAQMTQKGRYNIRLAIKKEIKLMAFSKEHGGELVWKNFGMLFSPDQSLFSTKVPEWFMGNALEVYVNLAKETSERDGFFVHDRPYFENFLSVLGDKAFLLLAYDEEERKILAGAIITVEYGVCTYYYGASTAQGREKMAPYLIQWGAMSVGKHVYHAQQYDFLGIGEDVPTDPLYGVTQFKKKFGGFVREDAGTFEYICHVPLYVGIVFAKKLQRIIKRMKRKIRPEHHTKN